MEITDETYNAFFAAANALHDLAGDSAPSPEQLMRMAVNPDAAAGLYEAFIRNATPDTDLSGQG
jgi:hypothetical protein